MQIQKISFTPNQFTQKQIQFKANQQNAFAPQEKNNTKRNVIIATAVTVPVALFGIYKMVKRGKANEVVETIVNGTKEAPKFKNPDAENTLNQTRELLTRKPVFSPEALDERITNGATKPDAWSFDDMAKYYEELEEQAQAAIKQAEENARRLAEEIKRKGQETVASLEKLGKGTSVVDEKTINNVLETQGARKSNAWEPADMKRYYESGCIEDYVENGKRIIKYPTTLDGKSVSKIIYPDGKQVEKTYFKGKTVITTTNKNGAITEQQITINKPGKMYSEETTEFNPKTGAITKTTRKTRGLEQITTYGDDIKSTYTVDKKRGVCVEKLYQKQNGKYVCIGRTTTDYSNAPSITVKTVEQLKDGYSKTTIANFDGETVIIRDKKGNIIDEKTFNKKGNGPDGSNGPTGPNPPDSAGKLLDPWYTAYLKLCKEFGVQPRMCGVKGGAWDHFYELRLRKYDPEAYEGYLRIEAYRARYNEKSQIMQGLREGYLTEDLLETLSDPSNSELLKELRYYIAELSEGDYVAILRMIKNGKIKSVEELLSTVQKIKQAAREAEEAAIRQAQRQRQRQEQEQIMTIYA